MSQRKAQPAEISTSRTGTIAIRTLGQFQLSVGGRSVQFRYRVQRRVLELLKALIALGHPSVGATRIMDALWNESEGDQASRCLATTIYRLRELLQAKDAVLYAGGQLILNPSYCRVDVWELERQLAAIESANQSSFPDIEELFRRHHEIAQLYRGDFLEADRCYSWTEPMRERLRARYMRVLRTWGRCLQQCGRHEEASLIYRKGLEVDPLAEECYDQHMRCLIALGRRTEAVLLYRRCCAVLQKELGLQPASQIHALYLSLREGGEEMPVGTSTPTADRDRRKIPPFSKKPSYPHLLR